MAESTIPHALYAKLNTAIAISEAASRKYRTFFNITVKWNQTSLVVIFDGL